MTYLYERAHVHTAIERARKMDRLATPDKPGNFTYDAIYALFDYYEDLAESIGEPIELDVIAWCCEWAQYDSIEDAAAEYDTELEVADLLAALDNAGDPAEAQDARDELRDWLADQTTVLDCGDGSVLIQSF